MAAALFNPPIHQIATFQVPRRCVPTFAHPGRDHNGNSWKSCSLPRTLKLKTAQVGVVVGATLSAPPFADFTKSKADLLAVVAGLDRGLVATPADESAADEAARKLEDAADAVVFPRDLDLLQGKWRLIFSSGFATGSFGGQRPGPSIARAPFSLGLVYQRIDVVSRELDNIVDLRIPTPWPLPPLQINATLAHSLELPGESRIRIVFQKTVLKPFVGQSQLPPFELPELPKFLRQNTTRGSGEFSTTYLDEDFRISRGDRGELRIFIKA